LLLRYFEPDRRDEFAIAGKERAAQRSYDVPNGRKLAMDLLFPRSAKS